MIKKLYTALFADDDIFSVNLNNVNLDNNFDEDWPDTIVLIRLLAWYSKFKKWKHLEKVSEELMPIEWHLKRW